MMAYPREFMDELIARSDIASIVDSLVAPLSLINALIVAMVIKRKDEVKKTFSELEQVWHDHSIYASNTLESELDEK